MYTDAEHTLTQQHTHTTQRERKRKYLWLFVFCFTPSSILYSAPYKSHMEGLLLIWHFWGLDLFCHNTLPVPKTHSVQIQLDNWIKTLKNWNWTWCSEGSWPTVRATVQSNGLHREGGNDREGERKGKRERGGNRSEDLLITTRGLNVLVHFTESAVLPWPAAHLPVLQHTVMSHTGVTCIRKKRNTMLCLSISQGG